jgi:hypothetical protein
LEVKPEPVKSNAVPEISEPSKEDLALMDYTTAIDECNNADAVKRLVVQAAEKLTGDNLKLIEAHANVKLKRLKD